jgi:hypothetical protein
MHMTAKLTVLPGDSFQNEYIVTDLFNALPGNDSVNILAATNTGKSSEYIFITLY